MSSAQDLLDRVHSLEQLAGLEAEPGAVIERLRSELPPATSLSDLEARDATLSSLVNAIDVMCARAMRVRLEHVLAADTSIGPPTRKVFASTVTGYADNLSLLAERARDIAERGRAVDPEAVADVIVTAARSVLDLRATLRADVLAMIRELAKTTIPDADRRARDRKLPDLERKRWSAVRRDLEAVTADPDRMLVAPMATRLAALPVELDEPAPEPEPGFKDLLELA